MTERSHKDRYQEVLASSVQHVKVFVKALSLIARIAFHRGETALL